MANGETTGQQAGPSPQAATKPPVLTNEEARRRLEALEQTSAQFSALHNDEYMHGEYRRREQEIAQRPTRRRPPAEPEDDDGWDDIGPLQTRMDGGRLRIRKPATTWSFDFGKWGPWLLLAVAMTLLGYSQLKPDASPRDAHPQVAPAVAPTEASTGVPQYYLDALAEMRDMQGTQRYPTGLWWRAEPPRRERIDAILEEADRATTND